jgi:CheY-like chemotaxis protein
VLRSKQTAQIRSELCAVSDIGIVVFSRNPIRGSRTRELDALGSMTKKNWLREEGRYLLVFSLLPYARSGIPRMNSVVLEHSSRTGPHPELSLISPCASATTRIADHGLMNPTGNWIRRVGFRPCKGGDLEMQSSRVLVAEDFEPFRRLICSTLRKRPEFQIIEEVTDGLQAVQKAEELQPDLIMLDTWLPSLNGIDAARRIRKLSPKSKILFMSQESSADVVREAFALGALGYVVKSHAGSELLRAVEAVLQGRLFVSTACRITIPPLCRMHYPVAHIESPTD